MLSVVLFVGVTRAEVAYTDCFWLRSLADQDTWRLAGSTTGAFPGETLSRTVISLTHLRPPHRRHEGVTLTGRFRLTTSSGSVCGHYSQLTESPGHKGPIVHLGRSWDRSHRVETTTARRRTHGLSSLRGSSQSKQAATICTIMFTDNHLQTSFALAPLHSLSQGLPQARIISTLQGSSPKSQELSTL